MRSRRAIALAAVAAMTATGAVTAIAPAATAAAVPVRIAPNPAYETEPFEGWGTSLVWFANATGGYPEDVRQDLFDRVFGEDGLNLNIARYNIGGGNATDVPPYLRPGGAVDGWWNPDLGKSDAEGEITSEYADRDRYAAAWDPDDPASYDFDADATQRWWIDALKDKITHWEAFSNSPPYFLTQSGYVSGGINDGNSEQLAPEDMDAFAGYLVTVVEQLEKEHGIDFKSLDPFNEPNTNYWSTRLGADGWPTTASRQEGAHIGPARQDAMIKALDARLTDPDTTTDVPISAMDETNPGTFVTNWNGWSQTSKDAVDQLNVHTYGTSGRTQVRDIAKAADKPLWMSEVGGDWDGTGFNLTNIENGLGLAGRMIDDLRELEPEAWVFWQPVEDLYNMEKVEKLNWGSVFIDFDCNADGDSERRLADGDADPSCKVLTNATYNTARNFTHYIQPGDRLVPSGNAQTTAAIPADGDGLTLVHANTEAVEREITIDLSRFEGVEAGATVTPIVTTQSPASDPTANALIEGEAVTVDAAAKTATITVPAKSVTTLLVDGVSGVSDEASMLRDGHSYQLFGVQSGKALSADPTALVVRNSATTPAQAKPQTWTVRTIDGEGTNRHRFALQAGDGRLLAVNGTSTALSNATVAQAADDPTLQWIASTTDGTNWSILSAAAERVLDVNGQSTADGASVGLWTSNGGGNQLWKLADTAVLSAAPITAATPIGVTPTLPAQATLSYAGGVTRPAAVSWNLDGQDWSRAGTVTVAGSGTDLFGATFEATATVEVGAYASADPTSVTAYAGIPIDRLKAAAPKTVSVPVGSSTASVPVTWDWTGVDSAALAQPGVVTVSGTATTADPKNPDLPATLSVILTEAAERNIAPQSTPTATFTESSSYGVERTINGVTSDKGWSNWRSGTKNPQDTLTYALAATSTVNHATIRFYKDGTNSWAKSVSAEYRKGSGAWTAAGPPVTVSATASDPAPTVDVPLGGVDADAVRVVLTANDATHMIVSEVEIYAAQAGQSDVADLAAIQLDGAPLDGFSSSTSAYEVPWAEELPTVRALPVDKDATVAVTQPADADGTATIVVTAVSGAKRTYTVAFTEEDDAGVAVAVTTRCVAGKVVVVPTVRNEGVSAVALTISTPYGTKKIASLAAGSATSAAFSTRAAEIAGGEVSVQVEGGAAVTARYTAASCS